MAQKKTDSVQKSHFASVCKSASYNLDESRKPKKKQGRKADYSDFFLPDFFLDLPSGL